MTGILKRSSLILLLIFTNNTLACDFSKGVTKLSDGAYRYEPNCHLEVGRLVQDNELKAKQITLLNQSIELKDLVIQKQDQRIKLWMDTTENLEQRLSTIERYKSTQNLLYFGLGIALSGLAVYGASQLVK